MRLISFIQTELSSRKKREFHLEFIQSKRDGAKSAISPMQIATEAKTQIAAGVWKVVFNGARSSDYFPPLRHEKRGFLLCAEPKCTEAPARRRSTATEQNTSGTQPHGANRNPAARQATTGRRSKFGCATGPCPPGCCRVDNGQMDEDAPQKRSDRSTESAIVAHQRCERRRSRAASGGLAQPSRPTPPAPPPARPRALSCARAPSRAS